MIIQPYQIKAQISTRYSRTNLSKPGVIYDIDVSCSSEYFTFWISKPNEMDAGNNSICGILPLVNDKRLIDVRLRRQYQEYCPDFKIISIDHIEYVLVPRGEKENSLFNLTMEITFYVDYSDLVLIKLSQE